MCPLPSQPGVGHLQGTNAKAWLSEMIPLCWISICAQKCMQTRSDLQQELFLGVLGLEPDLKAGGCDLSGVLPVLQDVLHHVAILRVGRSKWLSAVVHLCKDAMYITPVCTTNDRSAFSGLIYITGSVPLLAPPLSADWVWCSPEAPPTPLVCRCVKSGARCCCCHGEEMWMMMKMMKTDLGNALQGWRKACPFLSLWASSCSSPRCHSHPPQFPYSTTGKHNECCI